LRRSLKFVRVEIVWPHFWPGHFGLQKNLLPYDMIYLLTAIGLSPGGSSTVHIYTQTIHKTT